MGAERVNKKYTLCCEVTSIAKSQWHGRPAENIKVSSRSKTSVMGDRLDDATGILKGSVRLRREHVARASNERQLLEGKTLVQICEFLVTTPIEAT